jgi:CRISPR-associated protein Cas5
MPGKYYRSASEPPPEMLYGLLENALGWHLSADSRTEIIKRLLKKHGLPTHEIRLSGSGYVSVLQFHVRFEAEEPSSVTTGAFRYNDLWSQHLRTKGTEFPGGSRGYDASLIPLMNAIARKEVKLTDSGGRSDPAILTEFAVGDLINVSALRSHFPQYYVTPTLREYIVSPSAYVYTVSTTQDLAELIITALDDPAAPLYLGSNDGWVDVSWQKIPTGEEVQK